MITTIINWWYRQDYNIDSRHLSLFRIFYCLYAILIQGVPTYIWLNDNQSIPFFPPKLSLGTLFIDLPPPLIFVIITILVHVLMIFLLFGFLTKFSAISLSTLMLIGHSFKYSFGKIDHDIFFIILPFLLCNSGWGNHISLDTIKYSKKVEPLKKSVRYIALFFGYAMFIAGISKCLGGWLSLDSQAIYYYIFLHQISVHQISWFPSLIIKYSNFISFEIFDYLIIAFEIGFLFSVVKPKFFRFFICLAIIFHFTNFIFIGISFLWNIPFYILFINWKNNFSESTIDKITFFLKPFISYINLFIACILLLIQFFIFYLMDISPLLLQPSSLEVLLSAIDLIEYYNLIAIPILLILLFLSPKLYLYKN